MKFVNPDLWSLRQKLLWFVILPLSLAVLLVTACVVSIVSRNEMEEQATQVAGARIEDLKLRVDSFFNRANVLIRTIAARQKALGRNPDPSTMAFLHALLKATPEPEAQGLYIAFENKNFRDADAIQWVQRTPKPSRIDYDYHDASNEQCEWYWGAAKKSEGEHLVSKPYFDKGGANIAMVSVTRPIYDVDGAFIGVAGVDLAMKELLEVVRVFNAATEAGEHTVAYLVSQNERVFAHPEQLLNNTQSTEVPYLPLSKLPEGLVVGASDRQALQRIQLPDGKRRRISWTSSEIPGWKVVQSSPDPIIFVPLRNKLVQLSIAIGFLFLALMVWLVSVVVNWVTGPIRKLSAAAAAVEAGDYRPNGLGGLVERRDEFGQLARGFRRMVQEVSGREQQLREAQDDLAHRERHYRALIENATDLVTILRPDGTIQYKSPSVQRILGYTTDELIGRQALEFIHPDDQQSARASIRCLADHPETPRKTEYRFRHKDGPWVTLEAQCSDLTGDPAVGGIVINSRDITERKRDELEILHLNARLEERVRRRTVELEQKNEELQGAKEATDQAMKQQEIFLSNVAHDLRTPLTIVIGYSEDLLRRAKKLGQDVFISDLRLIVNRGKDLLELINDLLNLSKAMNDKGIELDLEEFDVEDMVRGRMEGISTIAQKYGNTIEFRAESGLGLITADKAKVWRVLMNLLSNACKFTKNGAIAITAGRSQNGNGEHVFFRVADTGIGMSPEKQSRLFDRFSQVHANSGKLQAGVGLGLSICQVYCTAMGGQIVVESEEGRGTTFVVTLPAEVRAPLSRSKAPQVPIERPARVLDRSVPSTIVERHSSSFGDGDANLILIIDDDASVCELMERNLDQEGFRARAAHSGEEGLRMAKQLHPSAIILDVVMPGLDGWAVLAALKSDTGTAEIPIIMVSMLDERERGLRMGADEYMMKPFGRDRLTDLLHKYLGNQAGARLLVVEDDVDARQRLCRSLRDQNWEVYETGDGIDGLALVKKHRPDLILLDLLLPSMNGFEFIEAVRRGRESRLIPIVVMTGAELTAEDRHHLQGQVVQVLQKGLYGRDELLREIRSVIREHQGRMSAPVQETVHG